MKSWLEKNAIETYSSLNERKSVVAERFMRTLKNNIYRFMNSIAKNVYFHNLDDIVNKYSNTYHSAIKMKPVDVRPSTYINSSKKTNDKDHKLKIGDIARKSKYKNIFVKGYVPNWSEEVFVIKKAKNAVLWTCVISDLKDDYKRFTKKNSKKPIKKSLELKK